MKQQQRRARERRASRKIARDFVVTLAELGDLRQANDVVRNAYVYLRRTDPRVRKLKQRTRSRYQRCPSCKKLRQKWLRTNHWTAYRQPQRWARLTPEGPVVCHICVARARAQDIAEGS